MIRVTDGFCGAKLNDSQEAVRVRSVGPLMVEAHNMSDTAKCVVSVQSPEGTVLTTSRDTAVTTENTGYTGNLADRNFTGQTLNNLPVIPGSIVVTPATAGVVLKDAGDGHFYTVDADDELAGSINYFTGAITLNYPTGKAPNGQLNAAYKYQATVVNPMSKTVYVITNLVQEQDVIVKVAADITAGAHVRVGVAATWA